MTPIAATPWMQIMRTSLAPADRTGHERKPREWERRRAAELAKLSAVLAAKKRSVSRSKRHEYQ
jgi:hypothetical protein